MARVSVTVQMLISAPSDLPLADLGVIRRVISQWNLAYGPNFGVTVLPVSWTEHATAEFGDRPQSLINKQLVTDADMALAIFVNRLGTSTGSHPSGTVEEIEEMAEAGKPVAILRKRALANEGAEAAREVLRLEEQLSLFRERGLVLEFQNEAELAQHVNQILAANVAAVSTLGTSGTSSNADVWVSVQIEHRAETDGRGRLRNQQHHSLVVRNRGNGPALDVSVAIESEAADRPFAFGLERLKVIEILPPESHLSYPIALTWGSDSQAVCHVQWTNSDGSPGSSDSTVRG